MSTIMQTDLETYQALKAQAEQCQARLAGLRQELMEKLDAGAEIEAGSLTAQVRDVARRDLSAPKLIPLLGADAVEELKMQVEPTLQRQLIVQAAPAPVASSKAQWDD